MASTRTKVQLTLLHSLNVKPEVTHEASIYVNPDTIYLIPKDRDTADFLKTLNTYVLAKEKAEAKYNNVLKGLEYWKSMYINTKNTLKSV